MLTRNRILDAALSILNTYGFADLSMRRLARELDVQPGALYWHVKNKQELLLLLAGRIIEPVDFRAAADDGPDAVRQASRDVRTALLAVRGAADVVSLAHALEPALLLPGMQSVLQRHLPDPQHSRWGAQALIRYILGAVTDEQTHAELSQAGLAPPVSPGDDVDAFLFGIDALLAGLLPGGRTCCPQAR